MRLRWLFRGLSLSPVVTIVAACSTGAVEPGATQVKADSANDDSHRMDAGSDPLETGDSGGRDREPVKGEAGSDEPGDTDLPAAGEGGSELDEGCTPEVELVLEDTGPNGQLFVEAAGGDPSAFVVGIGRHVCRILYRDTSELLPVTHLELIIRDEDGVAWKAGSGNRITVMISTRHLRSVADAEGRQAVAREIRGILYHEMAHMYQYDDRDNPRPRQPGEGGYARLSEVIEGVADFVRYRAGYMPRGRTPQKGGTWDDQAYNKPAFFLLWADTQYPGFVYRMNLTLASGDQQSWAPSWAFPEITGGKTEAELWRQFEAAACCSGVVQTCCR